MSTILQALRAALALSCGRCVAHDYVRPLRASLMPGNENEAAALIDAYLERANTHARLAAYER